MAKNGAYFEQLWAGDLAAQESESEADLALCCLLAFGAGSDRLRIENLFGRSGRPERGKWSSRPDYRKRTIDAALHRQTELGYAPVGTRSPALGHGLLTTAVNMN